MNDNLYKIFVFCISTAIFCLKYKYKVQEFIYVLQEILTRKEMLRITCGPVIEVSSF
jgi:hypothetical protein